MLFQSVCIHSMPVGIAKRLAPLDGLAEIVE